MREALEKSGDFSKLMSKVVVLLFRFFGLVLVFGTSVSFGVGYAPVLQQVCSEDCIQDGNRALSRVQQFGASIVSQPGAFPAEKSAAKALFLQKLKSQLFSSQLQAAKLQIDYQIQSGLSFSNLVQSFASGKKACADQGESISGQAAIGLSALQGLVDNAKPPTPASIRKLKSSPYFKNSKIALIEMYRLRKVQEHLEEKLRTLESDKSLTPGQLEHKTQDINADLDRVRRGMNKLKTLYPIVGSLNKMYQEYLRGTGSSEARLAMNHLKRIGSTTPESILHTSKDISKILSLTDPQIAQLNSGSSLVEAAGGAPLDLDKAAWRLPDDYPIDLRKSRSGKGFGHYEALIDSRVSGNLSDGAVFDGILAKAQNEYVQAQVDNLGQICKRNFCDTIASDPTLIEAEITNPANGGIYDFLKADICACPGIQRLTTENEDQYIWRASKIGLAVAGIGLAGFLVAPAALAGSAVYLVGAGVVAVAGLGAGVYGQVAGHQPKVHKLEVNADRAGATARTTSLVGGDSYADALSDYRIAVEATKAATTAAQIDAATILAGAVVPAARGMTYVTQESTRMAVEINSLTRKLAAAKRAQSAGGKPVAGGNSAIASLEETLAAKKIEYTRGLIDDAINKQVIEKNEIIFHVPVSDTLVKRTSQGLFRKPPTIKAKTVPEGPDAGLVRLNPDNASALEEQLRGGSVVSAPFRDGANIAVERTRTVLSGGQRRAEVYVEMVPENTLRPSDKVAQYAADPGFGEKVMTDLDQVLAGSNGGTWRQHLKLPDFGDTTATNRAVTEGINTSVTRDLAKVGVRSRGVSSHGALNYYEDASLRDLYNSFKPLNDLPGSPRIIQGRYIEDGVVKRVDVPLGPENDLFANFAQEVEALRSRGASLTLPESWGDLRGVKVSDL